MEEGGNVGVLKVTMKEKAIVEEERARRMGGQRVYETSLPRKTRPCSLFPPRGGQSSCEMRVFTQGRTNGQPGPRSPSQGLNSVKLHFQNS